MIRERLLPSFLGILLGLLAGLYYAWAVDPVKYVQTSPASLRQDFKEDCLALIASAYAATGDLARAQSRLALLPDPKPALTLGVLAQQRLAAGRPDSETRALALLASALGQRPSPPAPTARPTTAVPTAVTIAPTRPLTRTPTHTPTPTLRPTITYTPSPTAGAPFTLASKQIICDPDISPPLIQVEVTDAAGQPAPGIAVLVIWDTGQDRFFTGLKPDLGLGYGDFTMDANTLYTVQLVDSLEPVTGLLSEDCVRPNGSTFPGSWLLRFTQPRR